MTPVIVCGADRGELHCDNVTRCDQAHRIVRVFLSTFHQYFQLPLHCMDGMARQVMASALPSSGDAVIKVLPGISGSEGTRVID